eukprot:4257072-Pyramimonas_sp.AAC.1
MASSAHADSQGLAPKTGPTRTLSSTSTSEDSATSSCSPGPGGLWDWCAPSTPRPQTAHSTGAPVQTKTSRLTAMPRRPSSSTHSNLKAASNSRFAR